MERKTNCLVLPYLTKPFNWYSDLTLDAYPWWMATTKESTILEKKIRDLHQVGYKTIYVYIRSGYDRRMIQDIFIHNGLLKIKYKLVGDLNHLGEDLVDCDIIDLSEGYKEEDEYKRELVKKSTKNVSRYFNQLTFTDSTVIKKALTDHAVELQESEMSFYQMWSSKVPSMCKLIDYSEDSHEITIEKVNGTTAQDWYAKNPTRYKELITKVKSALEEFNHVAIPKNLLSDTEEDIREAFKNELIDKIYDRVAPVKRMIEFFIDEVAYADRKFYIDGMRVEDGFSYLMSGLKEWYKDNEDNFNASICHGDPNTDNTMIDENGNVKFIDPRGYFGKLKTCGLGLPEYDLAKFCYGLNGYSVFNSAPYLTISVDDDQNITVNYPTCDGSITRIDLDDMPIDDNIKIIIGIIWMKLSSYIINDPMKSVIAYLYGDAICTKYLQKKGYVRECDITEEGEP